MGALLVGPIFSVAEKLIDRIFPDKEARDKAKLEMLQLERDGAFKELELEYKAMAGQVAVNIEEAKNPSVLVSGWRPFVGWCCGAGLLYSVLMQPILVACGVQAPLTDTGVLLQTLFALLGVATLRSYEKVKGVARQ